MNKGQLTERIANDAGLTKAQAGAAIDAFMNAVKDTLKEGDKLTLIGFGSFFLKHRAERPGINPRTQEKTIIAAKNVVKFKVGADLDKHVNS